MLYLSGYVGSILGLYELRDVYRENRKENGNYYITISELELD